jgi:hypothetical protein
MPDNSNSIMVVLDHPTGAVPNGWTSFPNDNLIARRVAYSDFRKLFRNGKKIVSMKVFQTNPSGTSPFATEYSGNDDYAFEYDSVNEQMIVCKHNASGGGAGTTRAAFFELAGSGANTEFWAKEQGQVPMLGVTYQDSGPLTAQLQAAQALDTDDVPLG